jgi:hypothetical protein
MQQPMGRGRSAENGTTGEVSQHLLLATVSPIGRVVGLPTTLRYRAADPYAVAFVFHSAGGDVEWVVARTLLMQGLAAPVGEGDVRVYPAVDDDTGDTVTRLEFCSPDGQLVAQADPFAVQTFLTATFAAVPAGSEDRHLDIDGLVELLLQES